MLNIKLTSCRECALAHTLIESIDCQLAKMAHNLYVNITYILNKPVEAVKMSTLLHYKRIITYRMNNEDWLSNYSLDDIASKVNFLTYDCDCCNSPVSTTVTTTTSYVPPTTTTTTTTEDPNPLFFFGSDDDTLEVANLASSPYTYTQETASTYVLEVSYNNPTPGNYIYLLYRDDIPSLTKIYTEFSDDQVLEDWINQGTTIVGANTYNIIRIEYPLGPFNNYIHYFKFE